MKSTKSINYYKITLASLLGILLLGSCIRDPQSPGYEYMPDMYRSPAIEAYVDYGEIRDTLYPELNLTKSARQPVAGTVPMSETSLNDLPYTIPNTPDGYELAGEILKSPFPYNEDIINQGKAIYVDFCLQCHGAKGKGDGPVVTIGGHPAPPAYDEGLKDLSEGKMFHSITYGKGLMGPHKSQLSKTDRWKLVAYVKSLQGSPTSENDDAETNEEENK